VRVVYQPCHFVADKRNVEVRGPGKISRFDVCVVNSNLLWFCNVEPMSPHAGEPEVKGNAG
jgi:hypothetical protein